MTDGGIAISVSPDMNLIVENTSFINCGVGIQVRDEAPRVELGGLYGAPWMDLLAAGLATLRQSNGENVDVRGAHFRGSAFGRLLAESHDVDRLLEQLFAIEANGFALEFEMSPSMRELLLRLSA